MIHIATVHYQTDKWIDIQLKYIEKYIKQEHQIYAFLSGEAVNHRNKFYYACTEDIKSHAVKLNILADIISFSGQDDDILIFLDGDAFPVGKVMHLVYEKIEKHKLLAIQRLENVGDIQPHPSFCATTIGVWKKIQGDWHRGYQWKTSFGFRTDVGGNLLSILQTHNIDWYPLHRTSQKGNHPVFFGIYDNVIYHHGAGFREGVSLELIYENGMQKDDIISKLLNKIPNDLVLKLKYKIHPKFRQKSKIYKNWEPEMQALYKQIKENQNIFK